MLEILIILAILPFAIIGAVLFGLAAGAAIGLAIVLLLLVFARGFIQDHEMAIGLSILGYILFTIIKINFFTNYPEKEPQKKKLGQ